MSILAGIKVSRRTLLLIFILFVSFFSWYFSFSYYILQKIVGPLTESYLVVGAFNIAIVVGLLLSTFLIAKFGKTHLIYAYAIINSVASLSLIFAPSVEFKLAIIFLEGAVFGVGQLAFLAFFWELTESTSRSRIIGLVGLLALPIAFVVGVFIDAFDFSGAALIGAALSFGTLTIAFLNPGERERNRGNESLSPEKRTIFLYAAPWIIFSLVNATLARNISLNILQNEPSSFIVILTVLQILASGFGAFVGGVIADFLGRRLSLGFSLTLYGISMALGGLASTSQTLVFMYIANGLNWGILWTIYGFTIWGDLADRQSCAKRYCLGLATYYMALGIGFLLAPQIASLSILASSLAGCFLIFVSNLPLVLAPELLSSDLQDALNLKRHMNAVKKIKRTENQG